MIIANLYPIKSTNGLYHYALDYMREQPGRIARVLVRASMAETVRTNFPETEIVVCGLLRLFVEALRAHRNGDLLFTPTSHPLPSIDRQWIVLHDAYPFICGWRGRLKRALLKVSLATSNCRVAYINRTAAQPFIKHLGVSDDRQIFAPNRFPDSSSLQLRRRDEGTPLSVGLVGTDSAKKNYAQLFSALCRLAPNAQLEFHVYGHDSAYFREVKRQFPSVSLRLVSSDQCGIDEFFQNVDVLASVATQEGFGRPIAAALLASIPCVLVECGVFREFFADAAIFCEDAASVAQTLVDATHTPLVKPRYSPPAEVLNAYRLANARIAELGGASSINRH